MRGVPVFLRALVCFVLASAALPSTATPVRAEARADKQFADWGTFVSTGNNTVFVMFCPDSNDKKVELQLGKFQGGCGSTKLVVTVEFAQPAGKDYARENIAGEVRVDQLPLHKTVSRIRTKTGDKTGSYDVQSFENPQALLQEMASGQIIRFRFNLDNQEYYYRFSLNGFKPAYDRISQLCSQGARGGEPHAGQGGGQKPRQPKSDADYFDPPKSSGGKAPKADKDYF